VFLIFFREEVKAYMELSRKEIKDEHYDIMEMYIQNIPMAFLQLYLLFYSYSSFHLCSRKDRKKLFYVAQINKQLTNLMV